MRERGSFVVALAARACYAGCRAGVVELVDAPDSKSGSERIVGSTPTTRTIDRAFAADTPRRVGLDPQRAGDAA